MNDLYIIIVILVFFFQKITNTSPEQELYSKHLIMLAQFYLQNAQFRNKISLFEKFGDSVHSKINLKNKILGEY